MWPEAAAELLRVLKDVRGCGQRMRFPGEIGPASHQPRAVHVDQRVRDVQIFGDELTEERLVRGPKP